MSFLNYTGVRSPPRRIWSPPAPDVFPFCTSPAQLQDTTLEPNITLAFPLIGDENHAGKTSPMRIQSVKEYEEQLNTLMKENFNLKLRIFFLEEKMGRILSGPKDMEEAVKQNIELNVENETIRKELKDNKILLSQALKALELIEQEQNKTEVTKDTEIRVYKNRIDELEHQLSKQLDHQATALQSQHLRLEEEYNLEAERDQALEEVTTLKKRCNYIENELQTRCRLFDERENELIKKINDMSRQLQDYATENEQLQNIKERYDNLELTVKHKDEEISTLNRILDDKCASLEDQLKRRSEYRKTIEQQNQQLEFLNKSLRSRETMVNELEERLQAALQHSRTIESKFEIQQQEFKHSMEELQAQRKKYLNDETDLSSIGSMSIENRLQRAKLEDSLRKREDDIRLLKNQIEARDLKINKLETENTRALSFIRELLKREGADKELVGQKSIGLTYDDIIRRDQEIANLKKELRVIKDNFVVRSDKTEETRETKETREFERLQNDDGSFEKTGGDSSAVSSLIEKYVEEISTMDEKIKELVKDLQEKEQQIKKIEELNENNVHVLQTKDNRIVELEQEIFNLKDELLTIRKEHLESATVEIEKNDSEKVDHTDLINLVDKRGKEIERLEEELRKRTGNLQELVNKELWDKNREIERLQKRIRLILDEKESEIQALRLELQDKDKTIDGSGDGSSTRMHEEIIELKNANTSLKIQIEDLKDKIHNTPERDTEKLRSEIQKVEKDYKMCLKTKQEALDMCSLLTSRLEELALFLKALLKHKSVLGFLGIENQSIIKDVVDKSLDLSRNLSMSISINEDASLLQMSSITSVLDSNRLSLLKFLHTLDNENELGFSTSLQDIDPLNITLNNSNSTIFNKSLMHLLNRSKCELPREKSPIKSHEKSKINHELDQSESEAWSEPDRSVSLARIGLVDESIKVSPVSRNRNKYQTTFITESSSEDISNIRTPQKRSSEERSSVKRNLFGECKHNSSTLQEEVIKLQNMLKEKEQEVLLTQCEMIQKDNQLQTDKLKLAEQYEELKKQRADALLSVNEAEEKVKRAVEQRQITEEQLDKLSKMIEDLLHQKANLSIELESQIQKSQETIELLQQERDNALKEAAEAQKRAESAFVDVKLSEMRLTTLEKSYNLLKNEFDEQLNLKMKETEEKWNNKYENLDKESKQKLNELQHKCEECHVSKDAYNEKLKELETASNEIERLKKELSQFEGKINALKENETKFVAKIQQMETQNKEHSSHLRKELDEATLIASQAAVERTKVITEKNRLEKEVQRLENERNNFEKQLKQQKIEFTQKENDLTQTIAVLKDEKESRKNFTENGENNLLKQVSILEKQKNQLELHVSQLENINADLENRLVKAFAKQTDSNETLLTNKTSVSTISNAPKSHLNQKDFSGYTSEEIPVGSYEIISQNNNSNNVQRWFNEDQERLMVNSSPDLGIESDQGRFSSLEANVGVATVMRPFLPPLELTQTMNNMLSSLTTNDTDPMINISEIQKLRNENTILKARLMQTRKTLENTAQQLAKSNERKKQVEKAVCKQIHKTSLVLRKARANLDSGSENDVPSK
ncbi:centrosomin isoform X2 [Chrysoperla carnea]|uniref:centrosomin isoform X2 n=1 Tax=Chrysoperla carnea TaxID=189513 RepID=UPI001D08EFDC|nr:centrosomin isoform X2 [Chrysoperla carnea]